MQTKLFFGVDAYGYLEVWTEHGNVVFSTNRLKTICTKDVCNPFRSRDFFKKHGVTPTVVRKFFNMNYMKLVRPTIEHSLKENLKFFGKRVAYPLSYKTEHEELLAQSVKDKTMHLNPLLNVTGRTPKELREILGKGLWKQLANNSYSRNKLLAQEVAYWVTHGLTDTLKNYAERWSKVPSTLLRAGVRSPVIANIYKNSGIPLTHFLKKTPEAVRFQRLVNDTEIMLLSLEGRCLNPEWSKRRVEEEHDRLVVLQNNRQREALEKQNKNMIQDFTTLFNLPTVSDSGFVARPCTSPQQVRDEGSRMNHCVGCYTRDCAEGKYIVYSVVNKEGIHSTLGIRVNKLYTNTDSPKFKFTVDQHYRSHNRDITEDESDFADKVIEALLKHNKT